MAGRVEEDPPPVAARLVFRLDRAQPQQQRLGLVQIVDREIEVGLLRISGSLPGPVVAGVGQLP
ncbi:hypothetical protein San01_07890 [Streptomyces angustmyceticus]|uniref:Uncharacterized protein n=1 Tax=Streptomyces angustmyceticus TaxID=285578 RepID=A0A5J4L7W2_9ACTN|nr:hypothetical protein San01_07890 [Streptomyces angustmyceticus]